MPPVLLCVIWSSVVPNFRVPLPLTVISAPRSKVPPLMVNVRSTAAGVPSTVSSKRLASPLKFSVTISACLTVRLPLSKVPFARFTVSFTRLSVAAVFPSPEPSVAILPPLIFSTPALMVIESVPLAPGVFPVMVAFWPRVSVVVSESLVLPANARPRTESFWRSIVTSPAAAPDKVIVPASRVASLPEPDPKRMILPLLTVTSLKVALPAPPFTP